MDIFAEKRILTVSQLTGLIRGVLEENFQQVWVEGEASNLAMPGSGHLYFTLKDAGAQLRCVMFRASARALRFQPKDGLGLIVRGRLSVYDQRGDYQLIVEYLEPKGIGALQLAFSQLKEKLAKEGLFAEGHKRPLPVLPQRIGIVTSPTGAAIHDMLAVINRRYANVEILIAPVKVQGEGAAAEIIAAIDDFNRYRNIDVMIVGRGGGSLEDLWAFNEEGVARAIYRSHIPVISAVGHEVDFTIADLVADLRAPTPSAAAELVVKSKAELTATCSALEHRLHKALQYRFKEYGGAVNNLQRALREPAMLVGFLGQRLDDLQDRLRKAVEGLFEDSYGRIGSCSNRLHLQSPIVRIEQARERLLTYAARADQAVSRAVGSRHEHCRVLVGKLQALSPLATLSRGYAVAQKMPGLRVVTSYRHLGPGDRFKLILREGGAICQVDSVFPPAPVSHEPGS